MGSKSAGPRTSLASATSASPSLRGKVVAVVGADTFLGSNLIGLLEEDDRTGRIVALGEGPRATKSSKTRVYPLDLTDPKADSRLAEILTAERVDAVVHLAFLPTPSYATAWAHELESVGTRHTMVAARHAQVRKVVLSSQTILYGAHPSNPNFLSERHPLRANRKDPFFADKMEAEAEVLRFGERVPGSIVTVLRTAPMLGPTVQNYLTKYLSHRIVPTMMGFDPLFQFVHEIDAIAALKLAIDRDVPGIFNIVADGVLPLSTVIKLAGRVALPIPHPIAETATAIAWMAQLADAPPTFLKYLRFLCVADGAKAWDTMGFRPAYTTREALLDFTSAQRLRDVHLLHEPAA
jgi:UDP-glucose 4-epimerase